jgi:hypothetical protein
VPGFPVVVVAGVHGLCDGAVPGFHGCTAVVAVVVVGTGGVFAAVALSVGTGSDAVVATVALGSLGVGVGAGSGVLAAVDGAGNVDTAGGGSLACEPCVFVSSLWPNTAAKMRMAPTRPVAPNTPTTAAPM